MAIKVILGKSLVEKYGTTTSLDVIYSSDTVLVQGEGVEVVNSATDTRAVVSGKILGVRSGRDGLTLCGRESEWYRTTLCSLALEKCIGDFEGRYILVRIHTDGRVELSPDRFGRMDLYYQRVGEGYVVGSSLGLLPFKDGSVTYDQFGLAHSLYVYGFRPPKRHTLYDGVRRFGVGEYAVWAKGKLSFGEVAPHTVDANHEYGREDHERYADIWLDALEKRSSSSGNLVYLSSGWDSTSVLAGLVHLRGAANVKAVIGRFNFSERSGISNPFELKRVKAVCDYFGVELETTEIDHALRGPEIVERWQDLQRDHMFSGLSVYLWALMSEYVADGHMDRAVFAGEISDGVHNFGFSQHTTIHGHPVLEFREYSDKMASYLFGPNFLSTMLDGTAENDVIYDLLHRQRAGGIFDAIPTDQTECIRQLFGSMFARNVRLPFWSLDNSRIFTAGGREMYRTEMDRQYFDAAAAAATPRNLYSWYVHLYNSFHWQGGTVTTLGYTGERQGYELQLPFYDSRLHEFLAEMPESWGRGLEIRPTKYPLKWVLGNRIDYPLHLQVGPHSYLYDTDANFNFAGEFIYASAYTPLITERFKTRRYEDLLSPDIFDLGYYKQIVDNYLAGEEVVAERADLSALAFLVLTDWF